MGALVAATVGTALTVGAWKLDEVSSRAIPRSLASSSRLPTPLSTPILSLRRSPQQITSLLSTSQVTEQLAQVATAIPQGSCLFAVADGRVVAAVSPDSAVVPASSQKIITAAVALEVLGSEFRFETKLLGVVSQGTVIGDLTVLGSGDPLLSTAKYRTNSEAMMHYAPTPFTNVEDLVASVRAAGITSIGGRIVVDDSRFDAERRVATWAPGQVTPIGALVIDDSQIGGGGRGYATDPGLSAGEVIKTQFLAEGIRVGGGVVRGSAQPTDTVLASIKSAPLREVLAETLTRSDNDSAEMVHRELGAKRSLPGSRAGGNAVIAETLTAWGVPTAGTVVVDGSGLDASNRSTCRTLAGVLEHVGPASDLAAGLPRPGRPGTLADVAFGPVARERLAAKTGTLLSETVKALVGFVRTDDGRAVSFAVVLNAPDAAQRFAALWLRLGDAMVVYPTPVDLAAFGPVVARG